MGRIVELRSGGQSGADRGAMDAAATLGIPVAGWCPAGGWAEDMPESPGVRALFPQMTETPSADVVQRTEWNIRDSTCCIVLNTLEKGTSPGTDVGYGFYEKYHVLHFEIALDAPEGLEEQIECACEWLRAMDGDVVLSFGGPRASEYPGIYGIAFHVAWEILSGFVAETSTVD